MSPLRLLADFVSVVEVPLRIRVRDRQTTVVYWFIMSLILLYGGIYMFWKQRGYQASSEIAYSSEFRFRGSVAVNTSTGKLRVLDVTEVTRLYADGFFVATNYAEYVQTRDQNCSAVGRPCSLALGPGENGCLARSFVPGGILTGACLNDTAALAAFASGGPRGSGGSGGGGGGGGPNITGGGPNITGPLGVCEVYGWCPQGQRFAEPEREVLNWQNITWSWRVNIKMLGSVDSNNQLRTWAQELGPFTLGLASLQNDGLAKEVQAALAPGQGGADVALSIGFFCDLDDPTPTNCGLRKSEVDVDCAPFTSYRLDVLTSRTGGASVSESDLVDPSTRVLRNMTGLRMRLAITGEARESDLYTTIFNLGTLLWVTFLSQYFAELMLLRVTPRREFYEKAVYRDIDELTLPPVAAGDLQERVRRKVLAALARVSTAAGAAGRGHPHSPSRGSSSGALDDAAVGRAAALALKAEEAAGRHGGATAVILEDLGGLPPLGEAVAEGDEGLFLTSSSSEGRSDKGTAAGSRGDGAAAAAVAGPPSGGAVAGHVHHEKGDEEQGGGGTLAVGAAAGAAVGR